MFKKCLCSLIFMLLLAAPSYAQASIDLNSSGFTDTKITTENMGFDIYKGEIYDKDSYDGFTLRRDENNYPYYTRTRYIKLIESNVDDYIYNTKTVITLASGRSYDKSIKTTITTSNENTSSVTLSSSVGGGKTGLFKVISAEISESLSNTNGSSETITNIESNSFKPPVGCKTATYRAGVTCDLYEVVVDYLYPLDEQARLKIEREYVEDHCWGVDPNCNDIIYGIILENGMELRLDEQTYNETCENGYYYPGSWLYKLKELDLKNMDTVTTTIKQEKPIIFYTAD